MPNPRRELGDSFNPFRGDEQTPGCGFYPPDVVGMRRSLTDGQKRLYECLVRFAGRDGQCYPSHETLAEVLGKSDRQIRTGFAEFALLPFAEQREILRGAVKDCGANSKQRSTSQLEICSLRDLTLRFPEAIPIDAIQ